MTNPLSSLNRYPRRHFKEKNFSKISEKLASISSSFDSSLLHDFGTPILDSELNDLLDEVSTEMATTNLKKYSKEVMKSNLQPLTGSYTARSNDNTNCKPLTDDYELIAKLMKRINQLELAQRFQEKEIKDKVLRIKILEDKCKLYQKTKQIYDDNSERVRELENECERMQKQISEMESFLADYGLIWVGESSETSTSDLKEEILLKNEEKSSENQEDLNTEKYVVNYDKIISNIQELNMIVKSEESQVTLTGPQRVELKKKQSIPLVLYANGLSFFSGPFRSFADISTRNVVQDIIDGYFPSELEERYPSGVPIQVTDRRNIFFDVKQINVFQGAGKTLGGLSTKSKLLNNSLETCKDHQYTQPFTEIMCKDAGTEITVGQFLNKLPSHYISRNGRIISIRNSIKNVLENNSPPRNSEPKNITIDSSSQLDETSIIESNSLDSIAQIKIRSLNGDNVYHVNMKYKQSLRELYQNVSGLANVIQDEFVLVSPYPPNKRLVDMDFSIEECGLTPNASLCMKVND